jgi:hypothetical protein
MSPDTPESLTPVTQPAERIFEQPPDAVTCYADVTTLVVTESEVILQFYEPVPSPPAAGSRAPSIRSRLRATVILNKDHARRLSNNLVQGTRSS